MIHQGNRILRYLVEENLGAYEKASRHDKKVVSSDVVDSVKKKGRFLKEHLHGWVEIDDVAARLKVSHAFRDLRASSKRGGDEEKAVKRDDGDPMDISSHDATELFSLFDTGSYDDFW